MVARAYVLVRAEARAYHAFARFECRGNLRTDAPLALELALGVGDDDFQPLVRGVHGLAQRLRHLADAVGVDRLDPLDADTLQRTLHAHVAGIPLRLVERRGDGLRTRRRRVN